VKAVLQRVTRGAVRVDGEVVGAIGPGVVVLLGVLRGDGAAEADRLAAKVAAFRYFEDERGRMGRSILAAGGEALVVSQFTHAADGRRGRRPSFDAAAAPELAEPLVARFVAALRAAAVPVTTGRFGARMEVELVGDGPVTFVLDEPPGRRK
jgi:D-tyrosyl-tRNA(Tyr) deacylase